MIFHPKMKIIKEINSRKISKICLILSQKSLFIDFIIVLKVIEWLNMKKQEKNLD